VSISENFMTTYKTIDLAKVIPTRPVEKTSEIQMKMLDKPFVLEAISAFPEQGGRPSKHWPGGKNLIVTALDRPQVEGWRFAIPAHMTYGTVRWGLYAAARAMGCEIHIVHIEREVYFRVKVKENG
jgi:hypothetical protein